MCNLWSMLSTTWVVLIATLSTTVVPRAALNAYMVPRAGWAWGSCLKYLVYSKMCSRNFDTLNHPNLHEREVCNYCTCATVGAAATTKWDPWQISSDWLDVTQQNVSFFGIDHHVFVPDWALDVIWSITMAQTKASSALLLSLHDRSRGQGQGMMSKSDPSVTCYWYDKTRDTLVSLLEVHSPNWSLELQWKCLCPCNLHLIDPKGSGDGRADAKSHAKWTFTRSLSSFCIVSYISYLRSNYNTTASFGGALMQEEKTWPHSSLYNSRA